jgi:hypothetical protein
MQLRVKKGSTRRKPLEATAGCRHNAVTFTAMRRRNMLEIINHTPRWVFGLFIALVLLGMQQTRTRTVTMTRMTLLPLAMLALSFWGVWNAFDGSAVGVACWLGAMLGAALFAQRFDFSSNVRFLPDTRSFIMPGSWLPLVLMMAIFFTKYAVGASLAQHGELRGLASFVAMASLAYGFWSGIFIGRMAQILARHGRPSIQKQPA